MAISALTMEFLHPCQIIKAEPQKGGDRIKILIKASAENEDRDGETILKSAFQSEPMRASFVREGYYDYNHLTDILDDKMRAASGSELVELQKAKAEAIIGYPESLEVRDDGVYSTGYLIPSNRFVQEIRKGLEAGWGGWGASISGHATRGDIEGKTIKNLTLRKIAIAPLQEAINPQTSVVLAKSKTRWLRDIWKTGVNGIYSPDTRLGDMDDEMAAEQVQALARKLDLIYGFVMNHPDFKQEVARDIASKLQGQVLPLAHQEICKYVQDKYCFDPETANELANGILITYNL